jgi:hypothetical protein
MSAGPEVVGIQSDPDVRARKHPPLCDRNNAISTVLKCVEHARLVGTGFQPEMLLECFTRHCAFDLAVAD